MADRYHGPATLATDELHLALTVHLVTTDVNGTYSWDGHGTTRDLRALDITGGMLILPGGAQGPVYVPHTELNSTGPGVLVRLHGGGPAPY